MQYEGEEKSLLHKNPPSGRRKSPAVTPPGSPFGTEVPGTPRRDFAMDSDDDEFFEASTGEELQTIQKDPVPTPTPTPAKASAARDRARADTLIGQTFGRAKQSVELLRGVRADGTPLIAAPKLRLPGWRSRQLFGVGKDVVDAITEDPESFSRYVQEIVESKMIDSLNELMKNKGKYSPEILVHGISLKDQINDTNYMEKFMTLGLERMDLLESIRILHGIVTCANWNTELRAIAEPVIRKPSTDEKLEYGMVTDDISVNDITKKSLEQALREERVVTDDINKLSMYRDYSVGGTETDVDGE